MLEKKEEEETQSARSVSKTLISFGVPFSNGELLTTMVERFCERRMGKSEIFLGFGRRGDIESIAPLRCSPSPSPNDHQPFPPPP